MPTEPSRLSANPYEAKRQHGRRPGRVAVLVVVALLVAFVAPWGIDRMVTGDDVARNTTVDARAIGGLTAVERSRLLDEVEAAWTKTPVHVTTPGGALDTNLGALGVHLDRAAAERDALAVGRDEGPVGAIVGWWKRLLTPEPVPLSFTGDPAAAAPTLAELESRNHKEPVEASISTAGGSVELVAAVPGATLDLSGVHDKALAAARAGQRQITIDVGTTPIPPRFGKTATDTLLAEARTMGERRLGIYVADKSVTVDGNQIRTWLSSRVKTDGSGLELVVSQEKIEAEVPRLLGTVGTAPVQLSFAVDAAGAVQIVEGTDGTRCCASDSATRVIAALRDGKNRVDLDVTPVKPDHDRSWAEKLQIVEKVGEFTTPHLCCEPRVTNIHRFADIMRGKIIEPGKTMSLNDTVGQRTVERGFVEDHVIENGKFETAVGGGVSQFAATTFNAAFFAGLDIPEYQMHTIYIDRYPYGREATISWGGPDLKLENITPYGILVWPTYTDTSLTVTLYSTRFAVGEQTNQTKTEVKSSDPEVTEPCTRVSTERTRTFVSDNHTVKDTFGVTYQPGEGKTC